MRSSLNSLFVVLLLTLKVSCGGNSTPTEAQNTASSNLSCNNPALASTTAVIVGDDGKARITIPPNPDDLMSGGTLQLTLNINTTKTSCFLLTAAS